MDTIPDAWTIYRKAVAAGKKRTFWLLVSQLGLPGRLNDWGRPECSCMWTAFRHGKGFETPPNPGGWLSGRREV